MSNEDYIWEDVYDWNNREYELMDKILTIIIESSHIDGTIDLGNLIEKRHDIRMKMFKGDGDHNVYGDEIKNE